MTAPDPVKTFPALTLYGREECHLCQDMVSALRKLQTDIPFDLEIIDVDSDTDLKSRYGALVPVLMADGNEICHYHLDMAALEKVLGRQQMA